MTAWKTVQGSQPERPGEIDTTTSAVVVYQRKNIQRVTVEDPADGSTELWQYEEREMSRDEYIEMRLEQDRADLKQQRADIDYLSMATGYEL